MFVPNTFHTFHPHGNRLFLVNRNYRKKQFQFTTYIYEYIYIDKYLDCSKEINTLTSFIVWVCCYGLKVNVTICTVNAAGLLAFLTELIIENRQIHAKAVHGSYTGGVNVCMGKLLLIN